MTDKLIELKIEKRNYPMSFRELAIWLSINNHGHWLSIEDANKVLNKLKEVLED